MKELIKYAKNGQWQLLKLDDWMTHGDFTERDMMPSMKPESKKQALDHLASKTKVKTDDSGKRHFLLHRGVGEQESWAHDDKDIQDHTSWTPHYHVAHEFADKYNKGDSAAAKKDRTLSAWVPESAVHNIPIHSLSEDHKFYHQMKAEHEVVVKPHDFSYADKKTKNAAHSNMLKQK